MVNYFLQRFAYTSWADREALASLERAQTPPPRALQIMGHIIAAEQLWLDRLRNQASTTPVWPDWSLTQCAAAIEQTHALWQAYLHSLTVDDMAVRIFYVSVQGEKFSNEIGEVLTHVVTHGAYHRGQIAAELRRAGFAPAMTDFIHAARNKLFG
ncbi:MAG: DinB family protein [candidate division Zixibacteria bacterium]|nr:DinB family protein [candidate division Zixibacteria bacterium]